MAGTTFTWTTAGSSVWTLGTNWSPAGPPTAADTALISTGDALVNSGTVGVTDLSLGGSVTAPIPGKGTVAVSTGAALRASDLIAVWSGSTLSADAASSIDIGTTGTVVAGNVVVENGHSLVGDGLISASVENLGTIEALGTVASNVFVPGTLEIGGNIAGAGAIVLAGSGAILQLDGSVSTSQTIDFGTGSELILNAPGTSFAVPITNLNTGDKIEFAGLQVKSASVTSPGTVTPATITVITNTGSYQLTNVGFAAGSSQQFFTGTDPTNGDGYIQVAPTVVNWAGGSGDLGIPGNWQGGVAPNSTRAASFFTNPGTLTGSAAALSLNIGGSGNWTFNGATITVAGQPSPPFLPYAASVNTNVTFNNSTLAAGGTTLIGSPTGATVTVQGNSSVTTLGDQIGQSPGQSGVLILAGSGVKWTEQAGTVINGNATGYLTIGQIGTAGTLAGSAGFLTVTNGATLTTGTSGILGFSAGAEGSATISAGGIWNNNGISVGFGGSGTLAVSGGTVTSTAGSSIGVNAGASGTATISGGGIWNAQFLNVANAGVGTLTLSGGTLTTTAFSAIGASAGASGTVAIDSGGAWNATGLNVGNSGVGALILSAGTLTTTALSAVGGNAGGSGTATIGSGGTWNAQSLNVGNSGAGALTLAGALTTTAFSTIGNFVGGGGTATINGGGTWNAQSLNVGNSGVGVLTVNTGTLSATGAITVGASAGGVGTASVTSGLISAAGNVQVGSNGSGAMTIGSGGKVSAGGTFGGVGLNAGSNGSLQILNGGTYQSTIAPQTSQVFNIGNNGTFGTAAAATGSVLVTGPGSLLNLNGNPLSVGNNGGSGSLTINQVATVQAGTPNSNLASALQAGRVAGGSGAVTVTDANSLLSLAGFVLIGQGGTGSLLVKNSGSVAITNAPTNGAGFFIGSGFTGTIATGGGSGVVSVTSSGQLTAPQTITIGGNGADGTLNVNTGGTVLAVTGFNIANAATIAGIVYGGTGVLDIGAGGVVKVTEAPQTASAVIQVGASNGNLTAPTTLSNGIVTVSGAGALLDTNNNPLEVGRSGNGSLSVSQGASVVVGTPDSNTIFATGVGRLGNGIITVSDPGSTYTTNGFAFIGRGGAGSLVMENQGRVVVGLDPTGSGSISFGAAPGSGTTIQTGGSGTGLITGKGSLFSAQNLLVGSSGATGTLTITTNGTAEAAGRVLIGNTTTFAAGTTIVTTAGTTVAGAATALAGTGSVIVDAGSLLKSDGPHVAGQASIIVGNGAGSGGALTVQGAGATVDSGGDRIGIGNDAQGSVVVGQGGTVKASTQFAADIAGYLGGSADGTGSLTVTDPGSTYTNVGQIDVGELGVGHLLIENQGSMFTGNSTVDASQGFDIGAFAGSTGDATVTGSKSLLSNVGRFIVGDQGFGSFAIKSGGTVSTTPGTVPGLAGAEIAAQAGSDGSNVTVTGTGSDWQVGGALMVGDAASGVLSITTGATVSASTLDAGIKAGGAGIIDVAGIGAILTTTGSLSIGDGGIGEFSVLNGAQVNIGSNLNVGQTAGGSGNLDVEGTASHVTVTHDATIGANGVVTVGNNTTLTVTNNLVNNGFLLGNGLVDPNVITNKVGKSIGGSSGTLVANVEFDNAGTIFATNGTETIIAPIIHLGTLSGTGVLDVQTNGNLDLQAGVASDQKVVFDDATGRLTIEQPGAFNAVISNFIIGDVIAVNAPPTATFGQSGSIVSVIDHGATIGTLTFATIADASTAASTPGALVDVCFVAGTAIATPEGDVLVERLAVGDRVLTLNGEARPIIWIGSGKVLATRGRRSAATPVIIRKGALADNVPHRDLRVTKGHSLYLDGVLIPAEFLVNHRTIVWDDRAQEVTIYHIELATHGVLLANGAPAESYRDDGNRWLFQNVNPGWTLPPQAPCAPLLTGGPIVDDIWRGLLDRAGPRKSTPLTDDPDLHLLVDGNRIDAIERNAERYAFRLPTRPRTVRICSRSAVPQELGIARDDRCLGVSVRRIVLAQARRQQTLDADAAALAEGWHRFERENALRWSDGDAAVPASLFARMTGAGILSVQIGARTRYIDEGKAERAA